MESSQHRVRWLRWLPTQRWRLLRAALLATGFGLAASASTFLLAGAWDKPSSPSASAFEVEAGGGAPDFGDGLVQFEGEMTSTGLTPTVESTATAIPAPTLTPTAVPTPTALPQPAEPPGSTSAGLPAIPTATFTPPPLTVPECPRAAMSGFGLALFEAINSERTQRGLPALRAHGCAVYVAQVRSDDMARYGYFSHTSPTGQTAFSLLDSYGVSRGWAGENLARNNYPNDETVAVAIRDLMASDGHRANILNEHYTHLGVAVAFDGAGMKYYTMIFLGPP